MGDFHLEGLLGDFHEVLVDALEALCLLRQLLGNVACCRVEGVWLRGQGLCFMFLGLGGRV